MTEFIELRFYSARDRGAKYCDEHVCPCVCVCARARARATRARTSNARARVARRRRSAEVQCTRSRGLGYKLCAVIPVAGQRTHGTTFRALKVTSQVATLGARSLRSMTVLFILWSFCHSSCKQLKLTWQTVPRLSLSLWWTYWFNE